MGVATIYPDLVKEGTSKAERKLYGALQGLSDEWTVIHSVAWQSNRNGEPSDGEADFVLVHPQHGLIVIEVKGGGIRIEGGRWMSDNAEGRHPIKNPFEQAVGSKHSLVEYLRDAGLPYMDAGHAVAFPDITKTGGFGPSAPPDLIIDRSDLRDIKGAIDRVVAHSKLDRRLSDDQVMTITALLAPTTIVRVLLRDELAEVNARMVSLTEQQFRILDLLRRQRRALIVGGAGTGKSVLAVERARRLAAEGFSVLLTCFNRPLAKHLAKEFEGNPKVKVYSFHSLVTWQVKTAGMEVPANPEQDWWEQDSAERLVEAAEKNGLRFDALVVDEGQDFPPQWFTALQMLLTDPDNGPFYVFADAHQAIYRPGWQPPFPGRTLRTRRQLPQHRPDLKGGGRNLRDCDRRSRSRRTGTGLGADRVTRRSGQGGVEAASSPGQRGWAQTRSGGGDHSGQVDGRDASIRTESRHHPDHPRRQRPGLRNHPPLQGPRGRRRHRGPRRSRRREGPPARLHRPLASPHRCWS